MNRWVWAGVCLLVLALLFMIGLFFYIQTLHP